MSIINNGLLLASGADAATTYQISRSLRFNSADSPRLARTPGSAGNRKTWTLSCWVKRSKIGSGQQIFSAWSGSGTTQKFSLAFYSDDKLNLAEGSGVQERRRTTQVFRDTGAWFHLVVVADTTLATANDRYKIYVNGSQITTFDITNNPAQNDDTAINQAAEHVFGCQVYGSGLYNDFYDGYLADIYLLDGTATTPSTFAETDATTGQWVPKTPTGISYGTNGFRLSFSDNSGTTSTTLGKDAAGSNNWTPNNFSVASGSGNDSLVDTPTSYGTDTGAGGEVRGNYCTWNPIARSGMSNATIANGNLDISGTGSSYTGNLSTIAVNSGKWYYEFTVTNAPNTSTGAGIVSADTIGSANGANAGFGDCSGGYLRVGAIVYNNGSAIATGLPSIGTGDVLNVAFDLDAGKIWFGKNGTWDSSGNPATGSNAVATFTPAGRYFYIFAQGFYGSGTWSGVLNAGARSFAYTAPSGFKALCDTSLPAPVVAKPNTAFDVVTYTGNGSARSITLPGGFSPDLIWTKSRSAAYFHHLYDIVRGTNSDLCSNSTTNELTGSPYNDGVTAFNSSGYSLGTFNGLNENGTTYVAWAWDGGSSTVTNTQGSISSQVRANTSAGFSICSWTAPASGNFTWGHGLGVEPYMVIIKTRASAGYNWRVYHKSIITTVFENIDLNSTGAKFTSGTNMWGAALPTSTVVGSTANNTVGANEASIAYCFAPVAGYSSMGSYVGNGSSDGPFVYTGFRPKFVLARCSAVVADWWIYDSVRGAYNVNNAGMRPNLSNQETTDAQFDFLSNGFKLRTVGTDLNSSGSTHIYAAFAENPFQYARAR